MSQKIGYSHGEAPKDFEPLLPKDADPESVAVVQKLLDLAVTRATSNEARSRGESNVNASVVDGVLTTDSPGDAFILLGTTNRLLERIVGRDGNKQRFIVTNPKRDDDKHTLEIYVANGTRKDILDELGNGLPVAM